MNMQWFGPHGFNEAINAGVLAPYNIPTAAQSRTHRRLGGHESLG